jgi:2-methylcitrate dehydratase PrpD
MSRNADLLATFVARAMPPAAALDRAAAAVRDTVGVTLAGVVEPAARAVQAMAIDEGRGRAVVLGTSARTSASWAAMANGVAAHALDFDDMCFVSLAHPSCALFPAAFAAGERCGASGRALLEAYVIGFEIECRLGKVMNPRHYHERGWHGTSTIGTVGAAAAAARILGLSEMECRHALGIAASSACGVKENLGSMVKPLHAGMAARNGLVAALLAQRGYEASARALDGPQGFLKTMDAEHSDLEAAVIGFGPTDDRTPETDRQWEILATGITVKLYPSCAATHPTLDLLLDLRARDRFAPEDVDAVEVEVDSMTPRLLIYDRPSTALEGKFSMPYCAAAAIVDGHVGIASFDRERIERIAIQMVLPKITMRVNPAFDETAPLSHARVRVRLRDGHVLTQTADGARGYPAKPPSDRELRSKFIECARRSLHDAEVDRAWDMLTRIQDVNDVSALGEALAPSLERSLP